MWNIHSIEFLYGILQYFSNFFTNLRIGRESLWNLEFIFISIVWIPMMPCHLRVPLPYYWQSTPSAAYIDISCLAAMLTRACQMLVKYCQFTCLTKYSIHWYCFPCVWPVCQYLLDFPFACFTVMDSDFGLCFVTVLTSKTHCSYHPYQYPHQKRHWTTDWTDPYQNCIIPSGEHGTFNSMSSMHHDTR